MGELSVVHELVSGREESVAIREATDEYWGAGIGSGVVRRRICRAETENIL